MKPTTTEDREAADHGGLERALQTPAAPGRSTKSDRTLQPTPRRRRPEVSTTNARRELGVLGIESALDLVEHALLMIGEWHPCLPLPRVRHGC